jgi:protein O-GlcNAc transferase
VRLHPEDRLAHAGLAFALAQLPHQPHNAAFEEYKRWGLRHAPDSAASQNSRDAWPTRDRSPDRVLRIGYLSPDFREHSVSFFLENLIAFHNPAHVQVHCYSNLSFPDAVTERFRAMGHCWHDVPMLSDNALADLIRGEEIDILVDLAGHTNGNRLMAFAKRPAPIQVGYLGYVDTTGMSQIDYRLVDAQTDPPGMTDAIHTERLLRLPRTFACYRPPASAPPVSPLPALANGHVTFGCMSGAGKVHKSLLLSWAAVMSRTPGSRILFGSTGFASPTVQTRVLGILGNAGITADRVEFFGLQRLDAYLPLHHRFDILFDPFPVNGHTITCHAAWMGVPAVSRAGVKYVSRLGASVLFNLGLTELLAGTEEEYVEIAVKLASDLPRLAELRAGMRERMKGSPIMDYPGFAAEVEAAYREMWVRWCA